MTPELTRKEIKEKTLWVFTHNAGSMDVFRTRDEAFSKAIPIDREMTVRPYVPLSYITQLLVQLDAAETTRDEAVRCALMRRERLDIAEAKADAAAEQMRERCAEVANSQALLTRKQVCAEFLNTTMDYILRHRQTTTAYTIADAISALEPITPKEPKT